jgi:hypothetical protein
MRHRSDTQTVPMFQRVRRMLGELDYAQRRLFEIRTGVPALTPGECSRRREVVKEHRRS